MAGKASDQDAHPGDDPGDGNHQSYGSSLAETAQLYLPTVNTAWPAPCACDVRLTLACLRCGRKPHWNTANGHEWGGHSAFLFLCLPGTEKEIPGDLTSKAGARDIWDRAPAAPDRCKWAHWWAEYVTSNQVRRIGDGMRP
jgi:hypothetical protein